jgi:hypothetical protein
MVYHVLRRCRSEDVGGAREMTAAITNILRISASGLRVFLRRNTASRAPEAGSTLG